MTYMMLAFGCACVGFIFALNRKPFPAVALMILAAMLFAAEVTHHP